MLQDITPFLPGDTIAYLRLADGERRFPFRPVAAGLFLIGQGPACDLRLGLAEMPGIHSAIHADTSAVEIIRIAESPILFLNGEPTVRALLHDGDLIEVGDVRLVYHSCLAQGLTDRDTTPQDVRILNSRQLVDGLETELRLLASDDARHDRLQDLLKAAQQAVDACQFAQTIRFADYANGSQPAEEEESAAQLHSQILTRLASQENRLDEICNVLEQVVHQQQLIATALQCVVARLDEISSGSHPGSLRASA